MFIKATCEEVLEQAGLNALLLGNQRLRLFNRPVRCRENLGNFGLFAFCKTRVLPFQAAILCRKSFA